MGSRTSQEQSAETGVVPARVGRERPRRRQCALRLKVVPTEIQRVHEHPVHPLRRGTHGREERQSARRA
eukprot:327953-Prorocentrum_minimum.AAC.1